MQRSRAWTVVRAAARLKVLSARLQAEGDDGVEAALLEEADGPDGGPGRMSSAGELNASGAAYGSPEYNRVSIASGTRVSRSGANGFSRMSMDMPKKWYISDALAVKEILLGNWMNLLLICIPFGFLSEKLGWSPIATFTLNFFSLVPLALILGDITEDLALRFGDVVGGLINATFGNVVEIILSTSALLKGLYTVVATSLLGSILSNLLLVLGCSFLFGGLKYKTQTFNAVGNRACSSLLFLSCIGIIIPTAAVSLVSDADASKDWVLEISRGAAIILLVCYICYLVFQLKTHKELFQGDPDSDEPMMTLVTALAMLAVITVIVAFASEFLTGSIEAVSGQTGLGQAFLGMIVLPIAGNACEHITAVVVATKNKMDLSLGVAVGSSIQIALFAIPFIVIVGWITGHPFSLGFDPFSALALTISVIHSNFITADATSHWLLGVQLVAVYLLIAIAFLYR